MNKSHNFLNKKYYLISPELEMSLESGNYGLDKSGKHPNGLYVVKIKRLKSCSKIIYNYMFYNKLFTDSFLMYIYTRLLTKNLIKDDLNSNFIFLDSSIRLTNNYIESNNLGFNIDENESLPTAIKEALSYKDMFILYQLLFKLNFRTDMETIINILKKENLGQYLDIISLVFKDIIDFSELDKLDLNSNEKIKKHMEDNNIYNITDNCLIICGDLDKLIKEFNKQDFDINQGVQSIRGEVNNLNNFLSVLDLDFRNSLYYHHRFHRENTSFHPRSVLNRNKFSFKNIHMNLGSVRYYSTTRVNKVNRQNLFQENYRGLKLILEDNKNLDFREKQVMLEYYLNNQEEMFNKSKLSKLNFNKKSYDFLEIKKSEITNLISKDSFLSLSKRDLKKPDKIFIPKVVSILTAEFISTLLLSYFLEILSKESITQEEGETPGIPSISAYEAFGSKLLNKYVYHLYMKSEELNNGESLSTFKENNKNDFEDLYEDNFSAKLGGSFLGALFEVGLIYEDIDRKLDSTKEKICYIRIFDEIRSMLYSDKQLLHIPQRLPMVCEPKDYNYHNGNKVNLGGYLLNDHLYDNHIFKSKKGYEITTKLSKDNIIVSLINGLGKIPYKINSDTLEFIKIYGYEKDVLINDSDIKLQNFIKNPYNSTNKSERAHYRSLHSKIILENNILSIADTFSIVDKIYFPLRLDNRTRIYCETDYFDYQKVDLAKGLIQFSTPGIIYKHDELVIEYFKSFGANMFGNGLDKKSINSKVKWIDENRDYILNFRNNDIINKSENKVCFISFCFEFERYIKFIDNVETVEFYTYLPIQLDASCNAIQHLALLVRETKLFDKLNLTSSSHEDIPDDFYKYIVDKTNEFILKKLELLTNVYDKDEKTTKKFNSLNVLKNVSFDRSVVKKTIMTKSYNASTPKLVDNIAKNLTKLQDKGKAKKYIYKDENLVISRYDILTFVMCLKSVLDEESPKIKELSKYLDTVVKICTKLQMPVPWNLPSGAIIKEAYQKEQELSIKAFSFVKSRYLFKKYIKGSIDLRKQKRATMPNLIHSLDATTIALLYKDFKSIGNLYTVHDCFATTVDNVPFLMDVLKSVYINLYSSNDYLIQFDNLVKININKQYSNEVYTLGSDVVNIPIGKKIEIIQFPDINKVINIKDDEKRKIKNLAKSSYTLI